MCRLGEVVDYPAKADLQVYHGSPEWEVRRSLARQGRRFVLYAPVESTRVLPRWVRLAEACDALWCHTDFTARVWRDCGYRGRLSVVQNGVDPEDFPLRNGAAVLQDEGETASETDGGAGLRVLWIGTRAGHATAARRGFKTGCRKQGWLVREAFEAANLPGSRLLLKGYPWPSPEKDMTFHGPGFLGGDGWVTVRDVAAWWSREELVSAMHWADVLMWPTRGEGFGLVPLEAMATGLCAYVTDWSGPVDYLRDGLGRPLAPSGLRPALQSSRRGEDAEVALGTIVEALRECDAHKAGRQAEGLRFADLVRERWTWEGRVLPQLEAAVVAVL